MEIIPNSKQEFIGEHVFDLGKLLFYSNIVVGEFNDGVHVTKDNAKELLNTVQKSFGEHKPFIYISHRRNSYSMDAIGYKDVVEIFPGLKGVAVVSQNKYRRMLVSIEKLFIEKPIGVFDNMDSAFFWAENLLENGSQKAS